MAEILFMARNTFTGAAGTTLKYAKGDPIAAMPDGQVWGNLNGPNHPPDSGGVFFVVQVPGTNHENIQEWLDNFWEAAQPSDPEFNAPDPEDRRVFRHRTRARVAWDEVPVGLKTQLMATGIGSMLPSQLQQIFRKLIWNGTAVEIGTEEITP